MFMFNPIPIRRRSDKIAIIKGVLVAALVAVLATVAFNVLAHDRDDHGTTTQQVTLKGHNDNVIWIPAAIAAGLAVWCWFKCERTAESVKDPEPLNVTPPKQAEIFTVRPAQ